MNFLNALAVFVGTVPLLGAVIWNLLDQRGRFERIEKRLDGIDGTLKDMEKRLDSLDVRLTRVETKLDAIDARLTKLESAPKLVSGD
jgi:chromosome segregation ATPase